MICDDQVVMPVSPGCSIPGVHNDLSRLLHTTSG